NHTTPLATATEPDIDHIIPHVDEFDLSPVRRYSRVDLGIEQFLNSHGFGIGPDGIRVANPEAALLQTFHIVNDDVLQVWCATTVDDDGEITCIDNDIFSLCLSLFHEMHIIREARGSATHNSDA